MSTRFGAPPRLVAGVACFLFLTCCPGGSALVILANHLAAQAEWNRLQDTTVPVVITNKYYAGDGNARPYLEFRSQRDDARDQPAQKQLVSHKRFRSVQIGDVVGAWENGDGLRLQGPPATEMPDLYWILLAIAAVGVLLLAISASRIPAVSGMHAVEASTTASAVSSAYRAYRFRHRAVTDSGGRLIIDLPWPLLMPLLLGAAALLGFAAAVVIDIPPYFSVTFVGFPVLGVVGLIVGHQYIRRIEPTLRICEASQTIWLETLTTRRGVKPPEGIRAQNGAWIIPFDALEAVEMKSSGRYRKVAFVLPNAWIEVFHHGDAARVEKVVAQMCTYGGFTLRRSE